VAKTLLRTLILEATQLAHLLLGKLPVRSDSVLRVRMGAPAWVVEAVVVVEAEAVVELHLPLLLEELLLLLLLGHRLRPRRARPEQLLLLLRQEPQLHLLEEEPCHLLPLRHLHLRHPQLPLRLLYLQRQPRLGDQSSLPLLGCQAYWMMRRLMTSHTVMKITGILEHRRRLQEEAQMIQPS